MKCVGKWENKPGGIFSGVDKSRITKHLKLLESRKRIPRVLGLCSVLTIVVLFNILAINRRQRGPAVAGLNIPPRQKSATGSQ